MRIPVLTCSLVTALISGTAPADAESYRHIMFRESPYAPYRGIHPLEEAQADSVAHYLFERDDAGRITRISHRLGDTIISNNRNWDSFIWFAPDVRIRYEDGREIHTYFNASGEQIAAHGGVYEAIYSLNDAGERTSLTFFDADGEATESEWNIHRYDWRPSEDGHIFETREGLDGEMEPLRPVFHFYEVKLEYDADGVLQFLRNYGRDHTPTNNESGAGIDRIVYDLDGNFVRWQVYDHEGRPVEGNRPGVHVGEHLYDAYGNKIGMRGFDRFGNDQTFSWGAHLERSSFDARGFQTGFVTYNPDGSERVRLSFHYSADGGRQTEVRSLDENGQLIAHAMLGGGARVTYDDEGRPTLYDADGAVITASRSGP